MKVTTDGCLFGSLSPTLPKGEGVLKMLDVGTGTGLLSLMYAQKSPSVKIDAIEIDKDAAKQANENAKSSPWANRINIINEDAKSFSFDKKYDLIISNPPFYEAEIEAENEKKNLAHHSGGLLLDELLLIIKNNLAQDGLFFLLLPYKRNLEIRTALAKHEFDIIQITFVRQSVKHDYFRLMLLGKNKTTRPVETVLNEISICDEHQQYTKEFTDLLKDYYLHL